MKIIKKIEVEFPEWVEWVSQDSHGDFMVSEREPVQNMKVFQLPFDGKFRGEYKYITKLQDFFPDWTKSKMKLSEFKDRFEDKLDLGLESELH